MMNDNILGLHGIPSFTKNFIKFPRILYTAQTDFNLVDLQSLNEGIFQTSE